MGIEQFTNPMDVLRANSGGDMQKGLQQGIQTGIGIIQAQEQIERNRQILELKKQELEDKKDAKEWNYLEKLADPKFKDPKMKKFILNRYNATREAHGRDGISQEQMELMFAQPESTDALFQDISQIKATVTDPVQQQLLITKRLRQDPDVTLDNAVALSGKLTAIETGREKAAIQFGNTKALKELTAEQTAKQHEIDKQQDFLRSDAAKKSEQLKTSIQGFNAVTPKEQVLAQDTLKVAQGVPENVAAFNKILSEDARLKKGNTEARTAKIYSDIENQKKRSDNFDKALKLRKESLDVRKASLLGTATRAIENNDVIKQTKTGTQAMNKAFKILDKPNDEIKWRDIREAAIDQAMGASAKISATLAEGRREDMDLKSAMSSLAEIKEYITNKQADGFVDPEYVEQVREQLALTSKAIFKIHDEQRLSLTQDAESYAPGFQAKVYFDSKKFDREYQYVSREQTAKEAITLKNKERYLKALGESVNKSDKVYEDKKKGSTSSQSSKSVSDPITKATNRMAEMVKERTDNKLPDFTKEEYESYKQRLIELYRGGK